MFHFYYFYLLFSTFSICILFSAFPRRRRRRLQPTGWRLGAAAAFLHYLLNLHVPPPLRQTARWLLCILSALVIVKHFTLMSSPQKSCSTWFWYVQLLADKHTQVCIYVCMTRDVCTVTIKMVHVFVMSCTMLYKATSMSIEMLYELYSLHF